MGWRNQPRGFSQPLPSGEGVLCSPSNIYGLEEQHGCLNGDLPYSVGWGNQPRGPSQSLPSGKGVSSRPPTPSCHMREPVPTT